MMPLQRFRRADSGQAIVEVAVITPFLLMLLVSVIDIGRLNHYRTVVGNSARAAVQYGAQNLTTVVDVAGMAQAGQNDAATNGTPLVGLLVVPTATPVCICSDGSVAVCSPPTTCPTGAHLLTYAKVTSTYPFHTLFNYHVIPTTITVTRTETMEVAQ